MTQSVGCAALRARMARGTRPSSLKAFLGQRGLEGFVDFREKHDRRDAERVGFTGLADQAGQRPAGDAGHRGDRRVLRVLVEEHRQDEIGGRQRGFTNHRADGGRAAVAAGTVHGGRMNIEHRTSNIEHRRGEKELRAEGLPDRQTGVASARNEKDTHHSRLLGICRDHCIQPRLANCRACFRR